MRTKLLMLLTCWLFSMPASALLIESSSRALVGGSSGCCLYDLGTLDVKSAAEAQQHTSADTSDALGSASAWTLVDSRAGTLRGFATAQSQGNAKAEVSAFLSETIRMGLPDAPGPVGPQRITVTLPFDFTVDGFAQVNGVVLSVRRCEDANCNSGAFAVQTYSPTGFSAPVVNGELSAVLDIDFVHTLYEITASFSFETTIFSGSTFGVGPKTIDFSNTATLDLVLPDGFTFTSLSGTFLSANAFNADLAGTIPAPATLALLAPGLVLLSRRRPRSVSSYE